MKRVVLVVWVLVGCRRAAPLPEQVAPTPSVSGSIPVTPKAGVGSVVALPLGTLLAEVANGPVRRRIGGSPALVLETSGEAVRVLAADGTAGWLARPSVVLGTATVAWDKPIEGWKYAPEDQRFTDEGATLLPTGSGALSGASKTPYATSVQAMQVMGAEFLEQPLLSVQHAFVHPLTVTLRFPVVVDAHLRAQGFSGLVRPPFLGAFSLLALAPMAGDVTHVLHGNDELGPMPAATHHWSQTLALVIDPTAKPGAIEALTVVGDGGAVAFSLVPKTRGASFVLPRGEVASPWLGRCELADLDGDGRAEWLLEIVQRSSHGSSSKLVVIAGTSVSSSFSARVFELGGAPGEGAADEHYAFWVDSGNVFVAGERSVARLAWPAGALSPARPEIAATFDAPEAARENALARGLFAFPTLVKSHLRWAVGRAR